MTAPTESPRRGGGLGWLAGVLTFVLVAVFGILLATPSGAGLPRTAASTFVPADATRGKVTLTSGDEQVPAELSDARLSGRALPNAMSSTAYLAIAPDLALDTTADWYREAVVPTEPDLRARYRVRRVDDRGVWLVAQDWDTLGMTFDGFLELPAAVAAGQSWTSTGAGRGAPADGELRFDATSTASAPTDAQRRVEGCLSVASHTTIAGGRHLEWDETSLWCPGKGVVAGEGTFAGHAYAVSSGGEATPVSDDDLAETPWDPSGAAGWRLRATPVLAGDATFGLVDASTTPTTEAARPPVVTASGVVVFPTFEGGDLTGLVERGDDLWAHWWARPGGQVTGLATVGSLVVAPTTAHRVSAYRAGRTLAWNATLDDVTVAPPLPVGDVVVVATVTGTLTALDVRSGAPRWSSAVGAGVHVPLGAGDGVVVTADTGGNVTAWDLVSGAERWQVDDAANPAGSTLLVADGQVVVTNGGTVSAYAVGDGTRTWVRDAGLDLDTMTLVGDQLWLGVGDRLEAWSPSDGARRWRLDGAEPLTTASSRCVTPAGTVLGLVRRGADVAAVDGNGAVVASWSLPTDPEDVVTATCRGAGVDLATYAPSVSQPIGVFRVGPS